MKSLIFYYSWTGNTEVAAKLISQQINGEIREIQENKKRKDTGFAFGAAGFSAVLGAKSKIRPLDFSAEGFDNVFIGGQVWASRTSPAINTFLKKADLKGKKVYLFITLADNKKPQAAIDSITKRVEERGGKVVDSIFIQTKLKEVISPENIKQQITEWLTREQIS